MSIVHAIYENGVFTPTTPVALPEHCSVVFEPRQVAETETAKNQDAIYEILSRRHDSGDPYGSERHNEHQP